MADWNISITHLLQQVPVDWKLYKAFSPGMPKMWKSMWPLRCTFHGSLSPKCGHVNLAEYIWHKSQYAPFTAVPLRHNACFYSALMHQT